MTSPAPARSLLDDPDPAVRAWAASAMGDASSPSRLASPRSPQPQTLSSPRSASGSPSRSSPAACASTGDVISVCVRLRGLNQRELQEGGPACAWKQSGSLVWEAEAEELAEATGGDVSAYEFPAVFSPTARQEDVYAFVRPVVLGFLAGFHGTIFAFGQTSAGKTHTMQGPRDSPGVIPRALADLFTHLAAAQRAACAGGSSFSACVSLSYLELYNEELLDLLADEFGAETLSIRDGTHATVDGLRSVQVCSAKEAAQALAQGEQRRHVAATQLNRASSRSHAMLRVTLEVTFRDSEGESSQRRSQLSLVDLAGSERAATRMGGGSATASLGWSEGCHINMGLLCLGRVVRALASGNAAEKAHVPWRDSKLTRLLAGALGGNARAAAICCASPAPSCAADTRNTLRFGERCMLVTQRATLNEQLGARAQLAQAQAEIGRLRSQLAQVSKTQAERRLPGSVLSLEDSRPFGPGPAEAGLLMALEAEVDRLKNALEAERAALAAERRRSAALDARLTSLADDVARQGRLAAVRQASEAAASASAERARTLAAARGAVGALYSDMQTAQDQLRDVRADLERAGSPRRAQAPRQQTPEEFWASATDGERPQPRDSLARVPDNTLAEEAWRTALV